MLDAIAQAMPTLPIPSETGKTASSKSAFELDLTSSTSFGPIFAMSQQKPLQNGGDEPALEPLVVAGLEDPPAAFMPLPPHSMTVPSGQRLAGDLSAVPFSVQTRVLDEHVALEKIAIDIGYGNRQVRVSERGLASLAEMAHGQPVGSQSAPSELVPGQQARTELGPIEKPRASSTDLHSSESRMGIHGRQALAPLLEGKELQDSNESPAQALSNAAQRYLGIRDTTARSLDETGYRSLAVGGISSESATPLPLAVETTQAGPGIGARASADIDRTGELLKTGDRLHPDEVGALADRLADERSRDPLGAQFFMHHHQMKSSTLTKDGRAVSVPGATVSGDRTPSMAMSGSHRLQLDVPLSQTAMMHLDVSVQQRQVSANLLLDHPVIKHLAVQHVSELEDQLGMLGFQLREFDAQTDTRAGSESSFLGGERSSERHAERPRVRSVHQADDRPSAQSADAIGQAASRVHVIA
ncbi:MAG: hypothetical protein D6690_06575 [Nitrospirae bacterium]|nr:MAG: hypothetical protein D6690_06575 [Nitrospirota bacterium]